MNFIVEWDGPNLTLNRERTMNHFDVAGIKKQWRQAGKIIARSTFRNRAALVLPVGVEVMIWQPTASLADPAAHFPLAKSLLDGIVDAEVLPDDGPRYVAWTRFWSPTKDSTLHKALTRVRLVLVTPEAAWDLRVPEHATSTGRPGS